MMKSTFLWITLLTLTLFACSGSDVSLQGEWKLAAYGNATNPTPALPDIETSLHFNKDGQFGGTVGCNTFSGGYKINGDQVTFEGLISTLMFCEGVSEQESGVLEILSDKTVSFSISGNQLTLTDGTSTVVMEKK